MHIYIPKYTLFSMYNDTHTMFSGMTILSIYLYINQLCSKLVYKCGV